MSQADTDSPITYKDAGVDIDAGNALVERIKKVSKRTTRPEVLGNLGGFGALCSLPTKYKEPILVSGTDGVGTKLRFAMDIGKHDTVGIDLVAMCVNDLIVTGAEPLFFLDYYASGKLNVDTAAEVISGIGKGCELAGCALIGGETAEMPGMYGGEDYDLAGFCVGVAEKSKIIDGSQVKSGDALIGLSASGPHSNGFSLIRKVIERDPEALNEKTDGKTLAEQLIEPTRIYVKSLLQVIEGVEIKAIAHITGGGITENLPRVLPDYCQATIKRDSWVQPNCFDWIQRTGNISDEEMLKTFNCGLGIVLVVSQENQALALKLLQEAGEQATLIGKIEDQKAEEPSVSYE